MTNYGIEVTMVDYIEPKRETREKKSPPVKHYHIQASIAITIWYLLIVYLFGNWNALTILKCFLFCFLFFKGPDVDQSLKKLKFPHRFFLFHSIILPVLFTISFWGIYQSSFTLCIWGLHLLCDTNVKYKDTDGKWKKKQKRGTYLISFGKRRLTAKQTDFWLISQGYFAIILSVLLEVL